MKDNNLAERYWEPLIDKVPLDRELLGWHDYSLWQRYWWVLTGEEIAWHNSRSSTQDGPCYDLEKRAYSASISVAVGCCATLICYLFNR